MKDETCIFCKIAAGEIPSETVYEDDDFRAILDLNPATPGHTLILPKEHYPDLTQLDEGCMARVLPVAQRIGNAMRSQLGCAGFHILQNNGEAAGQTVMHYHMHVIPRYEDASEEILLWTPHTAAKEELSANAERIRKGLREEQDR